MPKTFNLYNLNFHFEEDFAPFEIHGYAFSPISGKQPKKRMIYSSDYFLKSNRNMKLNAKVSIPSRQKNSIFRKGGVYQNNRKIKLLDDILVIISILIGRNVTPKFYEKLLEFPLCSGKHCEGVSHNSAELQNHLSIAIPVVLRRGWQDMYENGFHVRMFYNASNIFVAEPRFLADMAIWEYLYYRNHQSLTYANLNRRTLNTKINFLVKEYLLPSLTSLPEERLRIFSDLRNQLSHNGKLPIQNPRSPFIGLSWIGCREYLKLFSWLTQVLVLKTLEIDCFDKLSTFNVRNHLDELVANGYVAHYQRLDNSGVPGL
jgi:hypothetical protein